MVHAQSPHVALDGLRGSAAVAVVLSRCGHHLKLPWLVGHGSFAVNDSLVIGGFALHRSYGPRLQAGRTLRDVARARFVRLYPLSAAGLLVGLCVTADDARRSGATDAGRWCRAGGSLSDPLSALHAPVLLWVARIVLPSWWCSAGGNLAVLLSTTCACVGSALIVGRLFEPRRMTARRGRGDGPRPGRARRRRGLTLLTGRPDAPEGSSRPEVEHALSRAAIAAVPSIPEGGPRLTIPQHRGGGPDEQGRADHRDQALKPQG